MEDDAKYVRITFRMPKDLHARLGAEAERTSKSMNAEIVARLQSTFTPVQQKLDLQARQELLTLVNEAIDERIERDANLPKRGKGKP